MADMRRLFAWLGAASLVVLWSVSTHAAPGNALKPYVVLILDTSGSMADPTGSGPPSCGGTDSKLNHARCAINNIVNSYGDIVFAFARFRETAGTSNSNGAACGLNASSPTNCTLSQPSCGTDEAGADHFELLTALVDGNNAETAKWVDNSCNTCTPSIPMGASQDGEVWNASGATPIDGALKGAKCYFEGLNATSSNTGTSCSATSGTQIWPSTSAGFAPITNDPTNTVFLPGGCDSSPSCTTNCCNTQCRPYITILLTDGDETCDCGANGGSVCADSGDVAAAQSLLTTDVGGKRYRVTTKPIGFGITGPYPSIEDIAHAGGAPDVAGANEGYYAKDEAGLELAISQIIEGSIRTEVCNGLDDDCDGNIDEDFPQVYPAVQPCDNGQLGACKRTGNYMCKPDGTGTQCSAPTVTPGTEICNGIDDDCDGFVDEGIQGCACNPTAEICNGSDDDCNNKVDDGIPPKGCAVTNSFGSCPGTQNCLAAPGCDPTGADPTKPCYGACNAATPAAEKCDGIDNNCDGICDGFNQACSNVKTPGGPSTDNLGDPSHNPIPENVCHPGQKNCPTSCNPGNTFGACQGEVQGCNPQQNGTIHCDVCNGLDDDCDNKIDEDFTSSNCSTSCGVGKTKCVGGQIVCDAQPAGSDTTCDGVDDDCDGAIDEDWQCDATPGCVGPNCCKCGNGTSCEQTKCVGGKPTCVATQTIGPEQCNCIDDDCDGTVDEDTTCGNGGQCVQCQCAFACSPGEFPCPLGDKCDNGFCVTDPCFNKTCGTDANGDAQVCVPMPNDPTQPECVPACSVTTCQAPLVCVPKTGECAPNDCTTFPEMCKTNETCVVDPNTGTASCVSNPCSGVTCPTDQYCEAGNCVSSCADVTCPSGQRCRLGVCETDPCGHPCPFGQACDDSSGMCHADPCQFRQCPQGDWCNPNDGQCEADPCLGTMCPSPDQVCKGGTCYNPDQFLPDAGIEQHVTVGGGGCNTSGGDATWLFGLVLLVPRVRRRRRQGGAQ